MKGKYRDFPDTPCPQVCIVCPIINILHQSGTFVTFDEPALMRHYHQQSIVYIRVHTWCCTFCGFEQMDPPL